MNFGLHDNEPGPRLEDFGLAGESLTLRRSQQVDLELDCKNDVTRCDRCRRGSTGGVIGQGGLNAGVHEAVLLEVPGLHVEFRFAGAGIDGHEANAEVRNERGGAEYPFQFSAA